MVECNGVQSRWLGQARRFTVQASWTEETIEKAQRLRVTVPMRSLVELTAVAVALLLVHRVVPLGTLYLMEHGGRADYRSSVVERVHCAPRPPSMKRARPRCWSRWDGAWKSSIG